ncbi:hypothetical protein [Brevibacillus migulae]|uniref:hypothetical protein n=1 Tax=Brevibacillus migulae TaxID=1644114 RepID=UPI0014308AC7|nr:hypothetical protein [Brevibacillus migulae]
MAKQTNKDMQVELQQVGAYGTFHKTTQQKVPLLENGQPAKQVPLQQDREE